MVALLHQARFGDFQLQVLGREAMGVQRTLHPGDRAAALHLDRGDVDRDAAEIEPLVQPGPALAAGLVRDPLAECHDVAGVLQHRDELGRTHRWQSGLVEAGAGVDRLIELARMSAWG